MNNVLGPPITTSLSPVFFHGRAELYHRHKHNFTATTTHNVRDKYYSGVKYIISYIDIKYAGSGIMARNIIAISILLIL